MNDNEKTKDQLISELMQMRARIADLENCRLPTQQGQVDACCKQTDDTARARLEEGLRQSESKYRVLVENAGEAIVIAQGGMLKFVNRMTLEMFGYPEDVLTAKPFAEFIHPEDRGLVLDHHIRRLRGEVLAGVYPFRVMAQDGTVKWVEVHAATVLWEGKPATLNFLRDITLRKRAEEDRRRLEERLQQMHNMESIGTLAGGIAHDFNNILGIITGCAEVAFLSLPEDAKARQKLDEIFKATRRAKGLVKQILTFSYRHAPERKPLRLATTVGEALGLLRASLPATIEILPNIDLSPEEDLILADPTQIYQLLMNLVTNAAHAMGETGGVLRVSLTREHLNAMDGNNPGKLGPGDYLKLTVEDSGHGIDQAVIGRIFDPYFTTKGPREGTGLGLSVVHGIVKDYGGAITVKSRPGEGAVFHVYLPRLERCETEVHQLMPILNGSKTKMPD